LNQATTSASDEGSVSFRVRSDSGQKRSNLKEVFCCHSSPFWFHRGQWPIFLAQSESSRTLPTSTGLAPEDGRPRDAAHYEQSTRAGHAHPPSCHPVLQPAMPFGTSAPRFRRTPERAEARFTTLQPQGRLAGPSPAGGTPPRPAERRPVSRRVRAGSPGRPSSRARRR